MRNFLRSVWECVALVFAFVKMLLDFIGGVEGAREVAGLVTLVVFMIGIGEYNAHTKSQERCIQQVGQHDQVAQTMLMVGYQAEDYDRLLKITMKATPPEQKVAVMAADPTLLPEAARATAQAEKASDYKAIEAQYCSK